jgi:hypothetical protein
LIKEDTTTVRDQKTGDVPQQRGLATTTWPNQKKELAGGNGQGDIVKNQALTKTL